MAGEVTEGQPVNEAAQALLDGLKAELGDAVLESEVRSRDVWVRIATDAWRRAAEVCRHQLGLDYFCFLSGIDWMPTAPNAEDAEAASAEVGDGDDAEGGAVAGTAPEVSAGEPAPSVAGAETAPADGAEEQGPTWETGVAGGDTRFQVLARLHSTARKVGIILKADLDDEQPRVESWCRVYRGADWHERETWEMFGFDFVGHPNLRHMYLPGAFEGFPLRKDFPLLSREVKPWPGLVDVEPMPEEEDAAASPEQPQQGAEAS